MKTKSRRADRHGPGYMKEYMPGYRQAKRLGLGSFRSRSGLSAPVSNVKEEENRIGWSGWYGLPDGAKSVGAPGQLLTPYIPG